MLAKFAACPIDRLTPLFLALVAAVAVVIPSPALAEERELQVTSQPPGAPQLHPQQVASNPVVLNWTAGSGGAPTSYVVQAGTAAGTSDLGVFAVGLSTSITANAPLGLRLYVRVMAVNELGSATSNEISFTIGGPITPPGPPTLAATQGRSNPVTLTWSPGPGGPPTRYELVVREPQAFPEPHVFVSSFDMGLATTLTADIRPFVQYFVHVVAENAAGTATSNVVVIARAPPTPAAPTMELPVVNGSMVHLAWSGPPGAEYTLIVRLTPSGPGFLYVPVGAVTSLDAAGVGSGTYYVSVVATVDGITSLDSNQVVVVVP